MPTMFAHGFIVETDYVGFVYKYDDKYHLEDEGCILCNDSHVTRN